MNTNSFSIGDAIVIVFSVLMCTGGMDKCTPDTPTPTHVGVTP